MLTMLQYENINASCVSGVTLVFVLNAVNKETPDCYRLFSVCLKTTHKHVQYYTNLKFCTTVKGAKNNIYSQYCALIMVWHFFHT